MTDRMHSPPFTLSLSLYDQPLFEVDLLWLIFLASVITCFTLIFFGFVEICKCPFFKFFDGFAALDHYFEFPQSLDYNYKCNTGIKNGINETDDNGEKDSAQHTSISPTEILVSGNVDPEKLVKIANPDNNPASLAHAALTSLADDLEFDVAHLTQAEAHIMLAELQSLRSTVGSRVSLFMKQSDVSVDAFEPDASYGEACLIDALMWLLRKRFPVQGDVTLEFSEFVPATQGEQTGERNNSKEDNPRGYNSGIPEQCEHPEMQSEHENGSENGPTTSGSSLSGLSSWAYSDYDPYPNSGRFRGVVPTARSILHFVKDALHDKLQNLSTSEIDTLLGRLNRRRQKIIRLGASAINSRRHPGWDTSRSEFDEYAALEKAQLDAYVGLVDGIMLSIRERCNASQRPLSEESCYTWSEYASDHDEMTEDEIQPLVYSRGF
jgi:hypothetical protein